MPGSQFHNEKKLILHMCTMFADSNLHSSEDKLRHKFTLKGQDSGQTNGIMKAISPILENSFSIPISSFKF